MRFKTVRVVFFLALALTVYSQPCRGGAELPGPGPARAKNIIFMIGDGMGLADVTAARIYKNGPGGQALHMELRNVGYARTYSESILTDSAASASAMACGEKFANGEICYHSADGSHRESILELAAKNGKTTGLVVTTDLTDATPAAFAAHVRSRKCRSEIARQYVAKTRVDVMLGGGASSFKSPFPDQCGITGDFLELAVANGYNILRNSSDLEKAVSEGRSKLLGLFAEQALSFEQDRAPDSSQPRLPQMAASALRILEKNPRGFFILIEGSLIDKANHSNNLKAQVYETLAFDETAKVVLDWIEADPARRRETLVIITADHETGGFAINGPSDSLTRQGEFIQAGWTGGGHTGTDVPVWSQGPGSEELNRPAIDNTEIYRVARRLIEHP